MESRNDLMLDENQHRLLMCYRMAKVLSGREIYLDATGLRMFWRLEKNGRTTNIFHSIDDMEHHLECLMESRSRLRPETCSELEPEVIRRLDVVFNRQTSRTKGMPILFSSKINRM